MNRRKYIDIWLGRRYNMTDKEKVNQLKDLVKDRKSFLTGEPEEDEIFLNDMWSC